VSARNIACNEGLSILGNPSARRREFRKLLKRLADGDAAAKKTALVEHFDMPHTLFEAAAPGAIKAGVAFSKSKLLEQRQCRSA
jgi:hypothetical protein